jgi:hypothetical protein
MLYAGDVTDNDNGDSHWVVTIQLGVRRLPAGFEVFAAPMFGLGARLSDDK